MNNIWETLLIMLGIFIGTILFGELVLRALPFGNTEDALLYLAAVIASAAVWVGRKK